MQEREGAEIRIRGAREHNLKNVDVQIPLGGITVVTGPSGSGKTSLAMSTLYAEGQRRYVETFSPYVRQFMDRMDRPDVDAVENVPPAIALGQRNSVKNSRSTVGTMTGMNEYLKLIYSRLAEGRDAAGRVVKPATPQGVADRLLAESAGGDVLVCFAVVPVGSFEEMVQALQGQGYLRVYAGGEIIRLDAATQAQLGMERWLVVQDRVKLRAESRMRLIEALETALRLGQDVVYTALKTDSAWGELQEHRSDWHPLMEPRPELFSGNSPLGACPACKGYGRAITYDYNLGVIPDKSIEDGALKMISSQTLSACYGDFVRANKRAKAVRMNVPWSQLTQKEKDWVFYGNAGDVDPWAASDHY
ncbi:MAG: excinuclease ABC subunit A, partial [Akkermansia sp.]|nr:excinuclease ABC subunit A [Akkermansia sp.]